MANEIKINKNDVIFCLVFMTFSIIYYCFCPIIGGISGDSGDGHYALWATNAKILHDGEFTFWNPHIWGGYGGVGHIQEVFYPILIILEFVFWNSDTQTLSYMILPAYLAIHFFIGCTGMYFLGRTRKKGCMVSFTTACLVMISGCFTYGNWWAYIFGSYCWITWLILYLLLLVETGKRKYIVLSGIILSMIGLCSSAQGSLFAVLIYAVVYILFVYNSKSITKTINKGIAFLISGIIGMGMASIQLVPFVETSINAFRFVNGWEQTTINEKLPLSVFKEDLVIANGINGLFGSYKGAVSISIVALLLILVGFCLKNNRKDWSVGFAKVLFIGSLLYSVGFGICDIFWYIPGFNAIREPILYSPFVILGGGLLIQDAIEHVFKVLDQEEKVNWRDNISNVGICNSVLLFAMVVACLPHMVLDIPDIIMKIIIVIIAMLIAFKIKISRVFIFVLAFGVLIINSYEFVCANISEVNYTAFTASEHVDEVNKLAGILLSELDNQVKDGLDPSARYLKWSSTEVLPANVAGIINQKDCFAYLNPIYWRTYFVYQMLDLNQRVKLQNIKYVLLGDDCDETFIAYDESVFGAESKLASTEVYSSYDATEKKNIRYIDTSDKNIGSGWLVNSVLEYSGSAETYDINSTQRYFDKINDKDFDVSKTVYVDVDTLNGKEKWQFDNNKEIKYKVECVDYNTNNIVYKVKTNTNGILITTEYYYPGWHVKIDGKNVDLYQVDFAFRGTYVEAGEHEIEFYYLPTSFMIGIGLFIVAIILVVLCFTWQKRDSVNNC